MAGRPTKFTPETRMRVLDAIALGATYERAAAYGGISYELFRQWMARGRGLAEKQEKARRPRNLSDADAEFLAFFEGVTRAEHEAAFKWLKKIETAADNGDWRAAAWKLERRYPKEYGRSVTEHRVDEESVEKSRELIKDVKSMTDAQLEVALSMMMGKLGGANPDDVLENLSGSADED